MLVTPDHTDELLQVAGTHMQVLKGGVGEPLLLLHGAGGNPGWLAYHRALSQQFTVYAPSHPGYDRSSRPDWISSMNDMAHFYRQFIDELGVTPVQLMGFSMGGWLAAEIVAMCPSSVKSLVLVDAAGIKPEVGEIAEILMVSQDVVKKLRFYDPTQVPDYDAMVNRQLTPEEEAVQWRNREMTSRLCWKPYFHNPKLPAYLSGVKVPTLIIWGKYDAIIPLNCGELYQQALSNSRLHVIDRCGHSPALEKPQEFLQVVRAFLSRQN
ncbi:MAG TPA: alpha/beta hydrolase [Candidatus Tectomicrobia bacterium]|nr:alpha/beta hydrolase [Candidatus Tectomicrobia bacterium]